MSFFSSSSHVINANDFTKPFPLADVCFRVEGKLLYSVRAFLAMHSPYFERMFSSEWEKKPKKPRYEPLQCGGIYVRPSNPNDADDFPGNQEALLDPSSFDDGPSETFTASAEVPIIGSGLFGGSILSLPEESEPTIEASGDLEPISLPTKKYDDFLALLKLLKRSPETDSVINDANAATLLQMADEYDLPHVVAECGDYIVSRWYRKPELYLKAVWLGDRYGMVRVMKQFVPRAAGLGFAQIQEYMPPKLSPEAYAVLVHSHVEMIYDQNAGYVNGSRCRRKLPANLACIQSECNRVTTNDPARVCHCGSGVDSKELSDKLMQIACKKQSNGQKRKY